MSQRLLSLCFLIATTMACATSVPLDTGDNSNDDRRDSGGGRVDVDEEEPRDTGNTRDVRFDTDDESDASLDSSAPEDVEGDGLDADTTAADAVDTGNADGSGGPAVCGDGLVQGDEVCDQGAANSDTRANACRTDCTQSRCGDGVVDTGETCDDGDDVDNNACSNTCVPAASILCQPCSADTECGRTVDRCVTLPGGRYCGTNCSGDADCPSDYRCASVSGAAERQCIPRSGVCAPCFDPDGDGYGTGPECRGSDCDETSTVSYVGATEVCDDLDNDCDGTVDDGLSKTAYWPDTDGDGFGNASGRLESCTPPAGYVTNDDDCNDTNPNVRPTAAELCDGLDNDCDGTADDGLPTAIYTVDADRDGFGAVGGATLTACGPTTGYATNATDCDDAAGASYPGATETCDGRDNDCDGAIDEGLSITVWPDADGDGFGSASAPAETGCPGAGRVTNNTDCNDANASARPGAPETCDGVDSDCDGTVDDGATCGTCTLRNNGGKAYLFCATTAAFTSARDTCNGFGSYRLVTINDATENEWVRSTYRSVPGLCTNTCRYANDFDCDDGGPGFDYSFCDLGTDCDDCGPRNAPSNNFWIGLNDRTTEGVFVWFAGSSTYTNWGSGEPNNSSDEDCTEVNRDTGVWNDVGCGNSRSYVCESL
jgi:hypothetical protein